MPWKPFIGRYGVGNRSVVNEYLGPSNPSSTAIRPGDWVVLTSGRIAAISGADPATLLGIAKGGNQIGEGAIQDVMILVEEFTDDSLVIMPGTTDPVRATHVGNSYGIAYDGTAERWELDISDTTATRMKVLDVDENRGWFICKVLEANRQNG